MAEMTGMFGPSAYEIEQQRMAQMNQSAYDFSKMNAGQRGAMGLYQAGSMFGDLGAKALGGVNPAVQNAQMTHDAAKQFDTSTPEGLMQYAAKIKDYDPNRAAQAVTMARKMQAEAAKVALDAQKQDTLDAAQLSTAKLQAAQAAKALRENPNLTTVEVGVKDKPGWMQKVVYDKTGKEEPLPIGEPYQTAQAMKISVGGGGSGGSESKQPISYVDPNTGQAVWGTISDARGKPAAVYDPNTRSLVSGAQASASAVGKSAGEAAAAVPAAKITSGSVNKAVDSLISMPGFSSAVGMTLKPGAQYVPGTKEADWRAEFKKVQGQAFNAAYETLRGGGQITEYETKSAAAALSSMDTAMSERQFIKAARDFKAAIASGLAKLEARAALQKRLGPPASSAAGQSVSWDSLK